MFEGDFENSPFSTYPFLLLEESQKRDGHIRRLLQFAVEEAMTLLSAGLEIKEDVESALKTYLATVVYIAEFLTSPEGIHTHIENFCAQCPACSECERLKVFQEEQQNAE